tara:strand:+ start:220 stop:513 length:294 start_codon:yes stop_codon:yes gene_type:complete
MKQINEIMKHTDAYKQLKKRKMSINDNVKSIKDLADNIYEERHTRYIEPVWFEIQKDDNPDIWDAHLDYLDIDSDNGTDIVVLKVVGYVEHKSNVKW